MVLNEGFHIEYLVLTGDLKCMAVPHWPEFAQLSNTCIWTHCLYNNWACLPAEEDWIMEALDDAGPVFKLKLGRTTISLQLIKIKCGWWANNKKKQVSCCCFCWFVRRITEKAPGLWEQIWSWDRFRHLCSRVELAFNKVCSLSKGLTRSEHMGRHYWTG